MDGLPLGRQGHPERSLVGMDRLQVSRFPGDHKIKLLLTRQGLRPMLTRLLTDQACEPDLMTQFWKFCADSG